MPDQNTGANLEQNGALPPASPADTTNASNGDTEQVPSAETLNAEGSVPFNEDKKLDYIVRQVTKKVQESLLGGNAAPRYSQQKAEVPLDDVEESAKELMQNHGLDEVGARKLALQMKKANARELGEIKQELEGFKMTMRFASVFNKNPDAAKYEGTMRDVFQGMNDYEKQFILNSPAGPEFLYMQAKKITGSGVASPQQRIAGTSARGGSVNPSLKTNPRDSQVNDALSAFQSGDRRAYEERVKNLINGR